MSGPKINPSSHHRAQHVETNRTDKASHASARHDRPRHNADRRSDAAAIRHVASQSRADSAHDIRKTAAAPDRRLDDDLRLARTGAHLGGPRAARPDHGERLVAVTDLGVTTERQLRSTKEATFIRRVTEPPCGGRPVQRLVIDTGAGDDTVRVEPNRGENRGRFPLAVTVNGERHLISRAEAGRLSIRAGVGDDRIVVGEGVRVSVKLQGGDGDDRIRGGSGNDRIDAGRGDDRVEGGAGDDVMTGRSGRDYINGSRGDDRVAGGRGNDVIYGGNGRDRLVGDAGNDYLEGSRGNDRLYGNDGTDVLSGGRGDDALRGGAQRDVMYAGLGRDRLYGGADRDEFYAQASADAVMDGDGDAIYTVEIIAALGTTSVRVDPNSSAEFRERVEADLDMLRSSPVGIQMLREHDLAYARSRGHNSVTITQTGDDNGYAEPLGDRRVELDERGNPGRGEAVRISYNPQWNMFEGRDPADPAEDWKDLDPVTVLYHEMAHSYNMVTGTLQTGTFDDPGGVDDGVNNAERQAMGLPNHGVAFDNDRDPSTPRSSDNRRELTENGFRDELGRPEAPTYRPE
ncbi:MAG TPA: M91 family zinc metallopeptidase [Pyrinomonadaceae bacterium]|nr:M91 family zinc metallopeptidase [Pyrinomonadaceae bacterium]